MIYYRNFRFEPTTLTMSTVDLTENGIRSECGVRTTAGRIVAMIEADPFVTCKKMIREIGVTKNAIAKHIKHLTEGKIIRHVGPRYGGHWEVVKQQPPM